MKVSEIFKSIQGEGATVGKLSTFVRLSGCNLKCGFCDSKYALSGGDEIGIFMLRQEIQHNKCKNVVLTGGEPLLQQQELFNLIFSMKKYTFEIETNGTIMPQFVKVRNVHYNVSPKLKSSGNNDQLRINNEALRFFSMNKKSIFKFVIKEEGDLSEIMELVTRFDIPFNRVYLMPEGVTSETLKEKEQWIIEVCKKVGFNYSPRLHINIYGNKRGV